MIYSVWSEQVDHRRTREIIIWAEGERGAQYVAEPLVFKEMAPHDLAGQPTIRLPGAEADQLLQALLDHAWSLGMRPAGFLDTTRQVAALDNHIADLKAHRADMVAIVQALLKAPPRELTTVGMDGDELRKFMR